MSTKSLLVELFVEELPPKSLKKLGDAFGAVLVRGLRDQGLAPADCDVTTFASPRRLAVLVADVAAKAADRQVEAKLVPVKVGLDGDGKATMPLRKKLQALGVDEDAVDDVVPQLKQKSDGKNDALWLDRVESGATLAHGLQVALDATIQQLPIPKVMTYQRADGWTNVKFVRPAHRLIALHGEHVIDVEALGLRASNQTQGHRFEAQAELLTVTSADDYATQLREQGAVVASFAERRDEIARQLEAKSQAEGLQPIDDDELLDEVTALVERPNVLMCRFEHEFLDVPQECLILTMKQNQKYFPLLDGGGQAHESLPDRQQHHARRSQATSSVATNASCARASRTPSSSTKPTSKKKLEAAPPRTAEGRLPQPAWQPGRTHRDGCARWPKRSASLLGDADRGDADSGSELVEQAERAAMLAKADLLTEMVGEFPELQGIMGGYYARQRR